MGSQKISCDSLEKMNLKSRSEKIRRPPNAFMLYARDNRKRVADENPKISNKVVSSILGQMWKNTPAHIKKEYFDKAKEVGELHKRRYPDYVYCPRIARLQKMQKKKKKDRYNVSSIKQESDENTEAVKQIIKQENNLNEEDPCYKTVSISEYVPNNPGYCVGQNPVLDCVADEQDCDSQKKILDTMAYPTASSADDEDECNLQIDTDDEISTPKPKLKSQMMPGDSSIEYTLPDKRKDTQSYLSKNPQYWQATYQISEIPSYFPENIRNSEATSRFKEGPSYYLSNPQYSQTTSRIKKVPCCFLENLQYSQTTSRIKEVPWCFPEDPHYSQTTSRIKEVPCYFPENPKYSQTTSWIKEVPCCFPENPEVSCCFPENPKYSHATSLIREIPPYFLKNPQYSKVVSRIAEIPSSLPENSPSFCRDLEHFPGSTKYFYHATPNDYYQEPNTYSSPYHSYWNSQIMSYYQRQNDSCEDDKPFSYLKSYCPSNLYNPALRYLNRSFVPYYKDSSYALYPHLNEDMKRSQASENLVPLQNPETGASSFHIGEKENLSGSYKTNSNSDYNNLKHNNALSFRERSSSSPKFTSDSEINSPLIDNKHRNCEFSQTISIKCEQDV